MGALYQIAFPNGKSYIGITSETTAKRYKRHGAVTHLGVFDDLTAAIAARHAAVSAVLAEAVA